VEFFGVRLVGFNQLALHKLGLTVALIVAVFVVRKIISMALRSATRSHRSERVAFWTRQVLSVATALLVTILILSIWFDSPGRLATGLGLFSAGLAFALQKVVTSLAGYIVIMRGKTFSVGDRITMGGVRGDVISLGFIQTQIMEMGQPAAVQDAPPAMWVRGRQYTGRIVTVTNDKIFEEPIYNYTQEFPYLWDEMAIPVSFKDDRVRAEKILLDAAATHTRKYMQKSRQDREALREKYFLDFDDLEPRVFYRITDNWLELSLRFLAPEHGVRDLKDAMSRDILKGFDEAGIGIASATTEIVGFPELKLDVSMLEKLSRSMHESGDRSDSHHHAH
jgi:small-conductance mechanosensitive channel